MAEKHLGIFRDVTPLEARLDATVLRTLYRHGALKEGELAARCCKRLHNPEWKAAMDRLLGWDMVEVKPTYHGNTREVLLAPTGKYWGEELVSKQQSAEHDEAESVRPRG